MATNDFVVKNGLVVTEEAQILSTTDAANSTDTNAAIYIAGGLAIAKKAFIGTTLGVGTDLTIAGDLAVNGGDITTTATTFNLINANATTVNFAGAATTLEIGAASGTTNINNNLDVDGDVNIDGGDLTVSTATFNLANTTATTGNLFGAATAVTIGAATGTTNIRHNLDVDGDVNIDGGDLTVSTATFNLANTTATTGNLFGAATTLNLANTAAAQTISIGNASTGASTYNLGTGATSTGNTKTVNLGTGGVTGSTTNVNIGSTIGSTTTVNSGTLVGALTTQNVFNTVATVVNAFGAAGTIGIGATSGTVTINNPTVVGSQTTVNLWNTASTTVNAFGAATAVNIGANTGTATLRNPTVVGTQATVNLWNTTSTTVNAFGAATSIVMGAATGTTNIRHNLDVDLDINVDGGDITTNATTFNLINTTATAVNFAGATTTLAIGATSGTATLRNPTIVGTQATVNLWNTASTTVNAFGAATAVNIGANSGTLTIGNPTVVGTQATVNLWNTASTTVNAFGAATSVNIGAATGTTTINTPQLRIGGSDTGNFISFRGTTGDGPGTFNHTYIGERIHTAAEASELLIFKGNDPSASSGPDRVRVVTGEFRVDTYTTALSDTFENIGASTTPLNRMLITANGQVTLGAGIASTTTATGTLLVTGGAGVSGAVFANTLNSTVATGTAPLTVASTTLVTNLNADRLDGYQAAEASTVSTVVARNASGDINVRLVRSEFANDTAISGAMAFRINNSTDNYIRFISDTAAIQTFLNVPTRTGGNASGTWGINITGNAATVTNGVYTTGDQTIGGVKTFSSTISGSINGNAATVTNGVYTTGNQTIAGTKTFSSTISGSINGNAATATNLSTDRTNWSTNGTISAVVGQLAWKNYNNNHTIFDASAGTSPAGGVINNTNAAVAWTGTYPTLMGWNGSTTYGVRVDSARVADNGGVSSVSATSPIAVNQTTGAVTVSHANSGVTAGTYNNVTVNATGHVTGGSNVAYLTAEADTLATVTGRGFLTRASSGAFATNTQGTPGLEVIGSGTTNPAYMTFHRPGVYAVRFGLEGTDLFVGGWSMGNVAYKIWHEGNDGSGSGLDADLLDGFNSAQASTVSTVAVRDASGDINVRLVRSEFANQATISGAMAFRVNNTTDNYIRFCSDTAAIQTFLNVPTRTGGNASGTWAINVTGNAATATTLQNSRTIAMTGDVTYTSGAFNGSANVTGTATLATVNSNVGTFNNVTVNAKGLVTSASNIAYLTAEADTLATVTGRGASTNTAVTLAGGITTNATNTRDKIRVWSDGTYTIGMQNSITFGAVNNDYAMTFQMSNTDNRGFWWGDASHTTAQGAMALSTTGKLTVAHSVRIGFGETDLVVPGATHRLEVNGSFAATSKSFLIDHPTKQGQKLQYGSLEGPELGVYVRGKLVDADVIELPDYWTGLVHPDSITVNLTAAGAGQQLYVERVENNCVYIVNETGKPVNCYYTVYGERKDVDKLQVEID